MGGGNPVETTTTSSAKFQVNNAKLYVPVITLCKKQGFKRKTS